MEGDRSLFLLGRDVIDCRNVDGNGHTSLLSRIKRAIGSDIQNAGIVRIQHLDGYAV